MTKINLIITRISWLVWVVFLAASTAFADEAGVLAKVGNLEKQMSEMQNTMNWQKDKIRQLENQSPGLKVTPTGQKSDFGENYFDNNLKAAIGDSSKWLKGLKFGGDLRLRYEARNEQHNSATNDQNRFRFRLRFGFDKEFSPEMKIGFRVVSAPGESVSETRNSTNLTLDNGFAFKDISIDRAYATYLPKWAQVGPIQELEVTAGKFENPLKDQTVIALWDGDIVPEGAYERIKVKGLRSEPLNMDLDFLAGQWIVEEASGSSNADSELYLFSAGLNSKVKGVLKKPIEFKNYLTGYYYSDLAENTNFAASGGNFLFPGSTTMLASGYKVLETYNEMKLNIDPLPESRLYFDFAYNLSENAPDGFGADEAKHWTLGAKLGKAKKKGTWEIGYEYVLLEANSVPSVFTDSDFGGTDRRGSIFRAAYAFTDYLQMNFAMFFTNNITSSRGDFERDLIQTDLVWKF